MLDLSIIVPRYNRPHLLRNLLKSIPNLENIEVIVIDDKSNKELSQYNKLTEEFNGTNVRFFKNFTEKKLA